ncbi:amino acid permease [Tomitella fengzijianii]|nr:amino acid permease [Tomitella fengzijianii]
MPGEHDQLQAGLKKRHLTMLSLGGVIGAGFFVGISAIINQAGPAAALTCAITGVIVFVVMRMLGEMAVAKPCTGSFTEYARMAFGPWAGFATGWLYWYFWVMVVGIEAVIGGSLLARWFPDVPMWIMSAGLLLIMTLVNLASVGNFGEAEYWFAGIKVTVILAFIVVASLFVFGLWPGTHADFSNLIDHGGFMPNGFGPVLVGVVAVIFSMTGAELVTIAAAESPEPGESIRRATNTVVFRVLAFFVISTLLLVTMVPWDAFTVGESPFIDALSRLGVGAGADILNLVVLVAVLSCLNSGLYTASRMLFTLSRHQNAPGWMVRTNSRGVPVKGVLACTVIGYGCIAAGYIWPDTIFMFLVNSSGAVCLFVYVFICASEIRLRRRWERTSPEILEFRVWLFPVVPILVTLVILSVLVGMAFVSDMRAQLMQSLIAFAVILGAYLVKRTLGRRRGRTAEAGDASPVEQSRPVEPGSVAEADSAEQPESSGTAAVTAAR